MKVFPDDLLLEYAEKIHWEVEMGYDVPRVLSLMRNLEESIILEYIWELENDIEH